MDRARGGLMAFGRVDGDGRENGTTAPVLYRFASTAASGGRSRRDALPREKCLDVQQPGATTGHAVTLARGGRIDPGCAGLPSYRRAYRAPRYNGQAAGADPPLLSVTHHRASVRFRTSAWFFSMLLRTLLRDSRQQGPDFRLPIPTVTTKGPDRCELSGLGPPRDGFRVHPEHCGDLGRRK